MNKVKILIILKILKAIRKFLNILQFVSNYWRYYKFINSALEKFVEDKFSGDSITEIKNTITQTEIKNALSSTFGKVPKFNLKIYAYVYDKLFIFQIVMLVMKLLCKQVFYKCSSFNKSKIPTTSFAHNGKNTWIRS